MDKVKKIAVGLLAFVLVFSSCFMAGNGKKIYAAQEKSSSLKLSVSNGKLVILSGKKNMAGRTYAVKSGIKTVRITGNKKLSKVKYTSSNKKVLAVNNKGKATLKKPGRADIKITAKYNKKTITGKITIRVTSKKILVAYFSRAGQNWNVGPDNSIGNIKKGNTEIVAEMIAEKTGADLHKIQTKKAYPSDYMECVKVANKEQEEDARPELKSSVKNWDSYDVVFLGYPIWCADMPMALYTFLESYDFSGKTIIPFCTNEGSGLADTEAAIKESCPEVKMKQGFEIEGNVAQYSRKKTGQKIEKWLKKVIDGK